MAAQVVVSLSSGRRQVHLFDVVREDPGLFWGMAALLAGVLLFGVFLGWVGHMCWRDRIDDGSGAGKGEYVDIVRELGGKVITPAYLSSSSGAAPRLGDSVSEGGDL